MIILFFYGLVISVWPTDMMLVFRLFNSFMLFTVVLYLFAIEYRVSPGFTIYVFVVVGDSIYSIVGIFNIWFIDKLSFIKLFNSFILFTVVLLFLAIEYRVSPFCTV